MKKDLRTLVLLATFALSFCFNTLAAHGAIITSNISVAGTANASLSGTGTANLTSASGNFKQWIPGPFGTGFHANIPVSAPAQTVGLSMPTTTTPTMSASGLINMDYDNITPGTPTQINSASVDLNGNSNLPFTINVAPIQINTSLGNFFLNLTVNGLITDLDFQSTGSSLVFGGNGGYYGVPGDFLFQLQASVTGVLTGVPIIGSLNLGTIFILPSTTATVANSLLPGVATTTDLDGGLPPFPNNMLANYSAVLNQGIQVPLNLPINVNQSANIPNGQSGFSSLNINGNINALMNLQNLAYNLNGTVSQTLVPEPASGILAALVLCGSLWIRRDRSVWSL